MKKLIVALIVGLFATGALAQTVTQTIKADVRVAKAEVKSAARKTKAGIKSAARKTKRGAKRAKAKVKASFR